MVSKLSVRIPADEGAELGTWLFAPEALGRTRPSLWRTGLPGCRSRALSASRKRSRRLVSSCRFTTIGTLRRSAANCAITLIPGRKTWTGVVRSPTSKRVRKSIRTGLVYGTSDAGGQAIVLGATDRRVRCVVALVDDQRIRAKAATRFAGRSARARERFPRERPGATARGAAAPITRSSVPTRPQPPFTDRATRSAPLSNRSPRSLGKHRHPSLDAYRALERAGCLDFARVPDSVAPCGRSRRRAHRRRSRVGAVRTNT